jgi:hypothetical protein
MPRRKVELTQTGVGRTPPPGETDRVVSRRGLLSERRILLCAAVALVATFAGAGGGVAAKASPARSSAWCANAVTWKTARQSVGDVVRVKARVVTSFYARSSRGRPTFVNLGYDHPDARRLTLVIWGADRVNFPRAPERMFPAGTMVCAQGMVSTYRGVPEIEIGLWDARSRLMSF